MIYTHVLNRGPAAVRSSVDRRVIIGANEQEQTLNQILTETDGFSSREGIIVLAATHQPEVLDKALLRPGAYGLSGRSNAFVVAPSG